MAFVLRNWQCLNPDCEKQFESGEPAPYCPACKCAKVSWVPSGMHIIHGATSHADRTLRSVAQSFGLTNLKSAREGEAAHPGVDTGKPLGMRYGPHGGIPISNKPTAGFAPNPPSIRAQFEPGSRFKIPRGARRIPTKIVANDPRKIPS